MRKKIYLAGKANGKKWQIASALRGYPHEFIASDDRSSKAHNWTKEVACFRNIEHDDDIKECVVQKLDATECVWAYLDTPDSFGSIAEIAYAVALKKRVIICVDVGKAPTDYDSPDYEEWSRHYEPLWDAYYLICGFPGVTTFEVESIDHAKTIFGRLAQTESPIEEMVCMSLLQSVFSLSDWVCQLKVDKYRLDFAFPAAKICIEVDGHEFHSSREARTRDAQRDRHLSSTGWRVLRFTGTEVYREPWSVVREIRKLVEPGGVVAHG